MKLYTHPVSTACRPVMQFIADNNIPCEMEVVDILKGAHYGPEYSAKNPNRLVPMLEDGDFRLTESATILRYLADRFDRDDLYPRDPRERATVDWVLDLWALVIRPALFPYEAAQYGIDVQIPGMLFASLARSPIANTPHPLYGTGAENGPLSFDDSEAMKIQGVVKVVKLDHAVAVLVHEAAGLAGPLEPDAVRRGLEPGAGEPHRHESLLGARQGRPGLDGERRQRRWNIAKSQSSLRDCKSRNSDDRNAGIGVAALVGDCKRRIVVAE